MDDKKYECLIFDLDGTLIDSASPIADAIIAAAKMHSLPIPEAKKVKMGIGRSFDYQYTNLFINGFDEKQLEYSYKVKDDFRRDFRKNYAQQSVSMFPGAKELLQDLFEQGYQMAIATNGPRSMLTRMLESFQIAQYFSATCCGDEFMAKPSPQMLEHIILELGTKNSRAIMIGDSEADMQAAKDAAIDSIFITNHNDGAKGQSQPDFVVNELKDLKALFF